MGKVKDKHTEANRIYAQEVLRLLNAYPGQRFETLNPAQIDALLAEADRMRFQGNRRKSAMSLEVQFYLRLQRMVRP